MTRALVVSIHDVAPATQPACAAIRDELLALGVDRCSLLVVPDYHHRGHFSRDAAFCEWLRGCIRSGDEPVVHGYFHQRPLREGESAADKMVTRFYTAGEGEFYDLGETEARALASRGREEFRAAGWEPSGFIAPAWLLSAPAEAALRDLRFRYTTRLGTVLDLATERATRSQSMVYSVRAAWRRLCSLVWNELLFHRLHVTPLLRIGIHPPDLQHPAIWRHIRVSIQRALADRRAMTYADWVNANA